MQEDDTSDDLRVDCAVLKVIVDMVDCRLNIRAELCSWVLQGLWSLNSFCFCLVDRFLDFRMVWVHWLLDANL